ncbi:MAG: VWA domain-containing protein [Terracidiphilus sp.]
MRTLRFIACAALAGLLISVPVKAAQGHATQAAAPPASAAPAQNSAPVAPSLVLHANANLVLVDVVVTDHGNPVHGLDRARFHVLEDGREQPITAFDEHQPATGPVSAAPSAPLPPNTYTNAPTYPESGTVNVLLLDALNTPASDQAEVRRQMLQYLKKIQPGTSLAIFTLSSRLRLIVGFTTDAAKLVKALEDEKNGPHPSEIPGVDSKIAAAGAADQIQDVHMIAGSEFQKAHMVAAMQQFAADDKGYQTDQRSQMTLNALEQLARYLSAVPGRKNLIWFSGSFPISLAPDLSLGGPMHAGSFSATRNYSEELRKTSELLSAARVAVYPVDARGLISAPGYDVSSARTGSAYAAVGKRVARDDEEARDDVDNEHGTMGDIAEQTGGQANWDTNDLADAVAKAVENGASYYAVGYVPAAKKLDGQYHKIQLRVDYPGYKLAYRRGYYADPLDKPSAHSPGTTSMLMAATMFGAPPATEIQFQARILAQDNPQFQGASFEKVPAGAMAATLKPPTHTYVVDMHIDPHGFTFDQLPDGSHQSNIEVVLVAYDTEGKRVNYLDRGYTITIKPERFAQTMANGIPVRLNLDLPAGQIALRVAVNDLTGGRTGSIEIPLAVADK